MTVLGILAILFVFCYFLFVICFLVCGVFNSSIFFFSSRGRHTRCALVTGVQRLLFRSVLLFLVGGSVLPVHGHARADCRRGEVEHRQGSRFAHGQSSRYWRTSPTGLKPAAAKCRDCSASAKMVVLPHWLPGTSSSFAHATYPRRRRVARLRRRNGGTISNPSPVDTCPSEQW